MAQKKVSSEHEAYKSSGKRAGKDSIGPAQSHELVGDKDAEKLKKKAK